jgi:hypothetical protein
LHYRKGRISPHNCAARPNNGVVNDGRIGIADSLSTSF